ncbi:MAG: regulatory protein RecX [Nitrospinae bacterium]|nr:regulatory protein RecX [Nitrospinota bacterium]
MDVAVKRAFNAACRLLAVRDRSVFEVRSALEKKRFDQKAVEGAVTALEERKLLDDRRFAKMFAESIVRNKKAGPRYIAAALVRKGIERDEAEGAANAAAADPQTQEASVTAPSSARSSTSSFTACPGGSPWCGRARNAPRAARR